MIMPTNTLYTNLRQRFKSPSSTKSRLGQRSISMDDSLVPAQGSPCFSILHAENQEENEENLCAQVKKSVGEPSDETIETADSSGGGKRHFPLLQYYSLRKI